MRDGLQGALRGGRRGILGAVFRLLASRAAARAAVTEPPIPPATTGIAVPQPSSTAELSIVTSRGFTAADGTLQGLFTSRGESIDYVKDALTAPGTFTPACVAGVQLVLHAGGCPMGIGWYNATSGGTAPPAQDQIYTLIPAQIAACPATIDPATACCDDVDLCPLATYDTTQMPQHRWNMPVYPGDQISSDPHYAGGLIGFVLMGVGSPDGRCNQNKYSQLDLNQASPSGAPWVGAVVYRSTVDPSSYYLGFEDQPTVSSTWRGQQNSADGDFNDFVIYVEGAACAGAGGQGGAMGSTGGGGAGGLSSAGGAGGGAAAGADGGGRTGMGGSASGGITATGGSTATGGTIVTSPGGGGGNVSVGSGGVSAGSGGHAAAGSGGVAGAASGTGGAAAVAGTGGATGTSSTGGSSVSAGSSGSKSGCSYAGDLTDGAAGTLVVGLAIVFARRSRARRR